MIHKIIDINKILKKYLFVILFSFFINKKSQQILTLKKTF